MPDIRLHSIATPDVVTMDWLQSPVTGLIVEDKELITAVKVALMSDAVAAPTDILPDPRSDDLRGWWGDEDAAAIWNGWALGSKLWLLTRAKILTTGGKEAPTLTRVQAYIGACLQPFVAAKIISSFTVNAWIVNNQQNDAIMARVVLYRGPKTAIALEFQPVWTELFPNSQPAPPQVAPFQGPPAFPVPIAATTPQLTYGIEANFSDPHFEPWVFW